jgi:predicted ATPase/DNA-binding CsgD family transcriptional regulator
MQSPFVDPLLLAGMHNKAALTLIGRESEMQTIRTLLQTVLQDAPTGARAMTIRGEMGVGKSRLLAEVYTEAQALGFRVIEGRVYEAGNLFPYFPFIEALRPVLRTLSLEQLQHYLGLDAHSTLNVDPLPIHRVENNREQATDVAEIISLTGNPFVAALAHLFPEIPGMLGVAIVQEELTSEQQKFRIFDALATLLERMSLDQPLVLSIDNLQWADSVSLEMTFYLTMRLRQSRIALLGATRPPNLWNSAPQEMESMFTRPSAHLTSTLAMKALSELMREGLLSILLLMPLQSDAAEKYLQQLLPGKHAPGLAQTLLSRAGGNPFFLEELVRALTLNQQIIWDGTLWQATKAIETSLPSTIIIAVKQRLQTLSSACQELLRIAAHFGRTFPLNALLHVLHVQGITEALDEALNASVLLPVENISDNISVNGIGRSLDIGIDEGFVPGQAQGTVPTVPSSFASLQDMALGEVPDPFLTPQVYIFGQGIIQEVLYAEVPAHRVQALHRAIGTALEKTYAHDLSPHVVELARHAVLGGDKAAALHWSIQAGNEAVHQQAYREAIGHLRLALTLLEAGEASPVAPSQEQLAMTIGELWFKLGELEQAERVFLHVLDLLQGVGGAAQVQGVSHAKNTGQAQGTVPTTTFQLAQANRYLSDIYRLQCHYDRALSHLQVAQTVFGSEQARWPVSKQVPNVNSSPPWLLGQTLDGELVEKGLAPFEREEVRERILLLQAQAMLDIFLNRASASESALWQSHQLAAMIGDRSSQAFALHFVGYLRGWGEHIKAAIRLIEQSLGIYITIGDPLHAVAGEHALGTIYLAQGELEQARSYTQRGFERARRYGVFMYLGWLHWNFSLIALVQGNWSECSRHLQEADRGQIPRLAPLILQARAMLAFRQGDWQQAEHYFRDGVQIVTQTEWYPGSLALYGHFLAVTGNHTAARTLLDKAANHPEPPGYGGDYYIPFLAEGYIHIGDHQRSQAYVERIRAQRGFMYYGHAVDRILAIVAAQAEDWATSEQAFADALALCRRAKNQPEEATIFYEMARVALMRSRTQPLQVQLQTLSYAQKLCSQAREYFLQYDMQRYVVLVETLQTGIAQLCRSVPPGQTIVVAIQTKETEKTKDTKLVQGNVSAQSTIPTAQNRDLLSPEASLDLHLTQREREVLCLVAEGHTDREVADRLIISPRTVNRHLSNIFVKLNVPGRAAAVAYAIRQSLV